ncbi:MAG: GBS Bsp-like repeat-containing protein [Blautia sp.]|nr:GBS Bsp-like repeat-containing protein [Blautia sp.]
MIKRTLIPVAMFILCIYILSSSAYADISRDDVEQMTPETIAERLKNGEYLADDVDLPDWFFDEVHAASAQSEINKEIIWNYLISKGMSKAGAAGIIGNLEWESSCLPNNLEGAANTKSGMSDDAFTIAVDNGTISRSEFITSSRFGVYSNGSYGYGLAQWTYSTRKAGLYDFANARGCSIGDLYMQLDYMWQEMSNSLKDYMIHSTDYSDACVEFHNRYEGSADDASRIAGRIRLAEVVYNNHLGDNYSNQPIAALDFVEGGEGTVSVAGWAFDPDNPSQSLGIHVYLQDEAGEIHWAGSLEANQERPDVHEAYGCGLYHGFGGVLNTNGFFGTCTPMIAALDSETGGAGATWKERGQVVISAEMTPPTIEDVYIHDIDTNGYYIHCIVRDNVGLREVEFPTWTVENTNASGDDQDDIIWGSAGAVSGTGWELDYRVNYSDHNNELNCTYATHIYCYDTSGNEGFYPIYQFAYNGSVLTSGYDQVIPDGDYIIATACSENKAELYYLDIVGTDLSASNGANVALAGPISKTEDPPAYDIWTLTYGSDGFLYNKTKRL